MPILLDAWGIGKKVCLNKKYKLEIVQGVYGIGGVGLRPSIPKYTIPPMVSDDQEYIDLVPFLLFDKILMDKSTFAFVTQNKLIPNGTQELFEYLYKEKVIQKIDYRSNLENKALKIIKETKAQIYDKDLYPLVIESAKTWKKYLLNLKKNNKKSNFVSDTIEAINQYINMFQNHDKIDQETLDLLEYQLWDVKCLRELHEGLKCPVYFWKDYSFFYNYDFFDRSFQAIEEERETFLKLWDLYVPFSISTNPDLFVKLREDSRLVALREFIKEIANSDSKIDENFLEEIKEEIANIDDKANKFVQVSGFLFLALSLQIPELSVAGAIGCAATAEIIKRILKRKYRRHYFLHNSHKLFLKNNIKLERKK